MARALNANNEQKLDAILRVCVRLQESLIFFYNEVKAVWQQLDEMLAQIHTTSTTLYDNQPQTNVYRSLIPIKNAFGLAFNFSMGVKLDYNKR